MLKTPSHSSISTFARQTWRPLLSFGISLYFLSLFSTAMQQESVSTHAVDSRAAVSTSGPVSLEYASYYGSSINNVLSDVVVDASGNIYATGSTISQGFDAVVVKYNAAGQLQWETLLGGTDADNFNANDIHNYGKIALDAAGNVYVTGITASDDFPTTNAFQPNRGGGLDAFVTKLDNDGNILLSSYLGGAGDENFGGSGGIAVNAAGEILIAGATTATSFFNASGSYQPTFSGGTNSDAFLVKISGDFSTVNGTFWGDESTDVIRDMAIGNDGTIWLAGYSEESSLSLPAYQNNAIDVDDGILLGFSADLSSLTGGTFFGGQFDDAINSIAIDGNDNILVTGSTFSTSDFPTMSAFQGTYAGGEEAFAAKFNASLQLQWSTFIGDNQNEVGSAIQTDAAGNVYVSGVSSSINFPVHRTAQETYNTLTCENDAFIFKFNADGTRDWATFYGGWRRELPLGIAINHSDQVIIVGRTESTDLPITEDAEVTTAFANGVSAFVSVFAVTCPARPILIHSKENAIYHDQFWCNNYDNPFNHYFQSDTCALTLIAPPGYTDYSWTINDSPISGADQRTLGVSNPWSATALPEYRVLLNDGNNCSTSSTSIPEVINWVRPMCGFGSSFDKLELPHPTNINEGYADVFLCPGQILNNTLTADGLCGMSYQWQKDFMDIPGATNDNYQVTEPGCYRVAIINDFTGCTVYSPTKKYVPLDEVYLNDYYANAPESCAAQDTVNGCTSVRIQTRLPHCAACDQAPRQGLTYTFYRDGVEVADNTYGYYSTTVEGNYTVEVSNGNCTITSNSTEVRIQPTEPPIWSSPTDFVCIRGMDSVTFAVSHPAIGDSATLRFDFPYPASDVITMDSFVRVATSDLAAGCVDVRLTTRDGCTSRSADIELHDTIPPLIQIDGAPCVPVRLRSADIASCDLDSVFWYLEDSIVYSASYDASYYAQSAGNYILRIKNSCGDFYSDSIYLSDQLAAPVLSPEGPICLPANLSIPAPDTDIIVRWYRNPTSESCQQYPSYLIPNEEGTNITANLPGYYYAVLVDTISGCVSTCSNIVEVQRSVAGANLIPANDIYFCAGTGTSSVALSVQPASPSYTYQWYRNNDPITGATNASYTTSAEGVYRVFLENSCDNAFTPVVNIFSVPNPNLTIDQPDTVYLCGPDTVRLGTDNDQPLIYTWYQDDQIIVDAVDSVYLATEPGKYQVYGLNNNTQCEDYSQEVHILNSTPIASTVIASAACTGTCSGTLTAVVSGGIPFAGGNYNYLWENGATTASISGLCAGTYQVTITDAIGCSTVRSGRVEPGFTLSAVVDSISCSAMQDGSISVQTNGGQAPFNFVWSTGAIDAQVDQLGPGTYSVTATDAQSCQSAETFTLIEPTALNVSLSGENASCNGENDGTVIVTASGGKPPYTYDWSSLVIPDSAMLMAGTYSLTITDQNNCQASTSVTITEPEVLTLVLNITNTSACAGDHEGALSSAPQGGTAPYQYLWSDGATTPDRSGLEDGTYMLTITDANGCQATEQISLLPIAPLEIVISDENQVSCWGGNDGSFQVASSGGTAPLQYVLNGAAQNENDFSDLVAGDYSVYTQDANGCTSETLSVMISSPDSLLVTYDLGATTCASASDGSAMIQVSGGSPSYTFAWVDGVTTEARMDLSQGSYTVTVSDVQLCEQIINFTIDGPDTLSTNFTVNDVSCFEGTDGSVGILETTGGTAPYEYFLEDDMLPPTVNQLDQRSAGSYLLRTVDANGCERSDQVEISEPELLSVTIAVEQPLTCFGGSDGVLSTTVSGGTAPYTYDWSTGAHTADADNASAGAYSVTITDALNCTAEALMELSEGPFIQVEIVEAKDISCNGLADGRLTLLGNGGTEPYTYFVNGVVADSNILSGLSPGDFAIYVQDDHGCISDVQNIALSEPEVLHAMVSTTDALCFGANDGTATIEVNGGTAPYFYHWNNGLVDSMATNLAKGFYEVLITDVQGCTFELSFEMNSPEALFTTFTTQDNPCFEDAMGSIEIESTTGGTAPYTYYLDLERITDSLQVVQGMNAGIYELKTVDGNQCTIIEEIVINEPDLFTLDLGGDQTIKLGESIDLNLEISNGNGELTFSIDPVEFVDCENGTSLLDCPNPSIILPTRNMIYQVTLTDEQGCEARDEIRIVVDRSKEALFMANIFSPNGDGQNEVFFIQSNPSVEIIHEFVIFDRWGDQVFTATNIAPNDPTFGWNGQLKGKAANTGVYIWSVRYRTIDGRERKLNGDVTLVR